MRARTFVVGAILVGGALWLKRPAPPPPTPAPAPRVTEHRHSHPIPAPAAPPEALASEPPPPTPGIRPAQLQGESAVVLTDEDRRLRRAKSEKLINATVAWLEQQKASGPPDEARLASLRIQRLQNRLRTLDGQVDRAASP